MFDINQVDERFRALEKSISLPEYVAPGLESELQEYLIMDREMLAKLNREGRGEISYRLQQFAFHVCRTQNRNIARLNRVKRELSVYAAPKLRQFLSYKTEDKLFELIAEDSYAAKLSEMVAILQERIDQLFNISHQIEVLAQLMKNLAYSAEKTNG